MNTTDKRLLTPIPARMQQLPCDVRGYPIPYTIGRDNDGKPNFRRIDMEKWTEATSRELCGICGQKIGYYKFFVGGDKSTANRMYFNPAMHEECARYALAVCPFLALSRFAYAKVIDGEEVKVTALEGMERPEKFGLLKTRGYKVLSIDGEPAIKADAPCAPIEWFDANTNADEEKER